MLIIISYIFKIIFSLLLSYSIFYFGKFNDKKELHNLLKYSFFCVFFLSPEYKICLSSDSFILFGFFTLALYMYLFINKEFNNLNIYFLVFISSV